MPQTISLHLKTEGVRGGVGTVTAILESRLGTLLDVEVFFDSSPDLRISTAPLKVGPLEEGKKTLLAVSLARSRLRPDDLGSWVRLGIRYLPDYDRLLAVVSNPASYPVSLGRNELVTVTTKNRTSKRPFSDAMRLFLKE